MTNIKIWVRKADNGDVRDEMVRRQLLWERLEACHGDANVAVSALEEHARKFFSFDLPRLCVVDDDVVVVEDRTSVRSRLSSWLLPGRRLCYY